MSTGKYSVYKGCAFEAFHADVSFKQEVLNLCLQNTLQFYCLKTNKSQGGSTWRFIRRKIPWMEKPRRLQSTRSLRVGHDWVTSLSLFTFMNWRRKWQPTPVFLPGESQGQGSLVGCRLWGRTESDTTEVTYQQQQFFKIPFIKCQSNYLYHQDP